ncbi:serine protease, partial [bacterium]|nr:serine protease [bacterium]
YAETPTDYFLITAGHVVTDYNLFVRFNFAGRRSNELPVALVKREYVAKTYKDYAVLRLSKMALQGYPAPLAIRVAAPTDSLYLNQWVVVPAFGSIQHSQLMQLRGQVIVARLPVYPGMSGAPIFDRTGTKVLGMVLTQSGEAIAHSELYSLVYN